MSQMTTTESKNKIHSRKQSDSNFITIKKKRVRLNEQTFRLAIHTMCRSFKRSQSKYRTGNRDCHWEMWIYWLRTKN